MDIGVLIFPTDQTIDPVELAREAEARGYRSLWFPEHSHIPTSRATPWGGRDGAPPLPEFYWRTHDPFVALAAAAAVTEHITLGTGICLVSQRDPIHTAKEVASLDRISDGRFVFGVGYGWNKEEMAQHGTAYGDRRALLREHLQLMSALWTQEEASYDGEHVSLEPSWSWPKPTQTSGRLGGPPIVLGGNAGPKTAADIAELCDGWMPIGGAHPLANLAEIERACEAIGRDPATVELGMFGARPDDSSLEKLQEQGFARAMFGLPQGPRDEVLAALDEWQPFVDRFAGEA
ncbi:MAG: LLM class F420-dependent oxidoreductase [Actinomycetota bacterium]